MPKVPIRRPSSSTPTAVLARFRRDPGFERMRSVFVDMPGALLAPLGRGDSGADELLEVRNMLATRAEAWERQEGEQRAEQRGEANLLRRLLERRFGVLPDWARDRIADSAALEEWGLRVLDAGSLDDVLT